MTKFGPWKLDLYNSHSPETLNFEEVMDPKTGKVVRYSMTTVLTERKGIDPNTCSDEDYLSLLLPDKIVLKVIENKRGNPIVTHCFTFYLQGSTAPHGPLYEDALGDKKEYFTNHANIARIWIAFEEASIFVESLVHHISHLGDLGKYVGISFTRMRSDYAQFGLASSNPDQNI